MSGNTKGETAGMKTEAIKQAISIARVYEDDINLDGAAQMATDELTAIETALAAQDVALRRCHSMTLIASSDPNGAGAEDVALIEIRRICTAALSPPTGKVLIDIERVVTFIAANTPTRCCGCVSRLIDGVRELKDTQ